MTSGTSKNATSRGRSPSQPTSLATFPVDSLLDTEEQMRRFELLRLAFFVLKLRKIEQGTQENEAHTMVSTEQQLRGSLLRHVIFQQIVTLTRLNAREQALQLIDTCRR